jgi:hypothetical protein
LGNNGGGKSRLFEGILRNKEENICIDNIEWKYIILDDFFKLSWNINYSVNKEILEKWNNNKVVINIFKTFIDNKKNKILFNFLNISEKNYKIWISFKLSFLRNIQEYKKNDKKLSYENTLKEYNNLINKFTDFFYEYNKELNKDYIKKYFTYLSILNILEWLKSMTMWIFFWWWTRTLYWKQNDTDDKNDIFLINYFSIINELWKWLFKLPLSVLNENLIDNYIEELNHKYNEEFKDIIKIKWFFSLKDYNENSFYKDIVNNYSFLDSNFILSYFNLYINFWNNNNFKSLQDLSAWEKTMLTRFTNIYMKIVEEFENWKKDFVILIDEPDLHLHLDWQKNISKN